MLGAVIFDFDGVITDSEILHFRAFNEVLACHDIQITMQNYYKNYLGLSDFDLLSDLVEAGSLKADAGQIRRLMEQKSTSFERLARSEGRIIEGVRDFLEMLRLNRVPMAICSGALRTEIELILEDAALRSFFDVIVSAEEVAKGKPHPDGFSLTLKRLNETRPDIAAKDCIVLEDSRWGLEAARAAGMHPVAITNSYGPEQLRPAEKVVSHLSELTMDELGRICS